MHVELDDWVPQPQVRTCHRRTAHADATKLWHAAERVQVCETPRLGHAVRWRIPDTPGDLPFRDLFRRYPFTVLAEGERWSVSGLCGRIWTLRRDYPRIDSPDDFLAWHEPGTVKVLFAHWVEPAGEGRAAIVSETRVGAVDRRARLRMRALWTVVGGLERLIGPEALRAAVRRAEASG
jgi:hypothetical protein